MRADQRRRSSRGEEGVANLVGYCGGSRHTAVGIVGSVIGGFLGRLIKRPEPGATFHPAGFLMSIVGAVVLLLALRLFG